MLRTCCAELRCKSSSRSSRSFWNYSRKLLAIQESLSGVRVEREGMLSCLASSPQLVVSRCEFRDLRDVLSAVNAPHTKQNSSRSSRRVNVLFASYLEGFRAKQCNSLSEVALSLEVRGSRDEALDRMIIVLLICGMLYASGEKLAVKWNGTAGERFDEHATLFGTTTTGIKLPTDSALRRGRTTPLSDSYTKVLFTTRAMAEAGEEAVPLIVVYVTVPNKETAMSLATSIVTNKLAACVNQVPGVVSTYVWEGKVETDEEILLIIKTRRALLDSLTAHVKSNHPYTVPEVIALPILGGSESYVKWVVDNTQKVGDVLPAV